MTPNPSKEAEMKTHELQVIEQLRKDRDYQQEAIEIVQSKLIATLAALEKAEKTLKRYAHHCEFCRASWSKTKVCDCGYDKALSSIAKLREDGK
jgi:hypothetical protein